MPHAPVSRTSPPVPPAVARPPASRAARGREPRRPCPRPSDSVVAELRAVIAVAHDLDVAALRARPADPVAVHGCLHLLGAGSPAPLRTAGDALGRIDELAHDLVARMRARGWAEGAAPEAVTSVLAASVPAAEEVLLRAARSRRR